jgi:hypothetical protein
VTEEEKLALLLDKKVYEEAVAQASKGIESEGFLMPESLVEKAERAQTSLEQ